VQQNIVNDIFYFHNQNRLPPTLHCNLQKQFTQVLCLSELNRNKSKSSRQDAQPEKLPKPVNIIRNTNKDVKTMAYILTQDLWGSFGMWN